MKNKFFVTFLIMLFFSFNLLASENKPTEDEVTKLYVATFNRAPDSAGIKYWLNSKLKLSQIAESFFDQEETKSKYPEDLNNDIFITEIYNNILGRKPDSEGKSYWLDELNRGVISRQNFILAIMNGAKDDDAILLNNKMEVGKYFAFTLKLNNINLAKEVMKNITKDTQTVKAIKEKLNKEHNRAFITRWKTKNDNEKITIPTDSNYTYNYDIDWGDGTNDTGVTGNITHTYSVAGIYTIKIKGEFPHLYFFANNNSDIEKLISIEQWGDIHWKSMYKMFASCHIVINANDTPNLSEVNNMCGMFYWAGVDFNSTISINDWNVSNVTNMSGIFRGATKFNQPLNKWNVSNVTNMEGMFRDAWSFNQPLNDWNVSNVTTMNSMFRNAKSFNQPLNKWNVANVTDMNRMFSEAKKFNQPLNNWNISNVSDISWMFNYASDFNQSINNWNVSNITDISGIFEGATNFNQPLNNWDISNVTNMASAFKLAKSFNQPLNNWDVSNVTTMHLMFSHAEKFNQDISNWDVSNVIDMSYMFDNAKSFSGHDLSSWNVDKVTNHINFGYLWGSGNTEPKWKQ